MNRPVRRSLVIGLIAVMAFAGVAAATMSAGIVSAPVLARGTLESGDKINTHAVKLHVREDTDVVTQTITISAGGHTGWHSHPGPVFVTITAGTMTFYDGDDKACRPVVYATGDTFIDEGGGHVHIARNEGSTDLVLYATYLLPVGAALRTDAANPGFCSF